ncbi:MAG: helix-turn-helix domain-containing protein [Candidatus Aenigmarchaeota archaeon]|nr:helix-turn-helix domain-containing protein [Candidatus Aenigmarchaeota archaeon]
MDKVVDELELKKAGLAKDVIGEIAMSSDPGKTIKKWRALFRVSQKELSKELGVTSSVISDYESGRRRSPGILFLKKYVEALMNIEGRRGGEVLKGFLHMTESRSASSAIADIREFEKGVGLDEFCRCIGAQIIKSAEHPDEDLYGYTVIDSVKAITELSFSELSKLYGVTTRRALIFTNITTGKGPMIAIKVANLKPALVILHNIPLSEVSDVAKNIAGIEGIPLAICENVTLEEMVEQLKKLG